MNDPKLQSLQTQHLRQLWGRQYDLQAPADSIFVDGTETYYDEYAQAWRFLGFYQDCDACADGSVDCVGNTICQRYALWAAVSRARLVFELFCGGMTSYLIHAVALSTVVRRHQV
jgi:hypothetical protein